VPSQEYERVLVAADVPALTDLLRNDLASAIAGVGGSPAVCVLVLRSTGRPEDVTACVQLLRQHGAPTDDDAFYHACERADTVLLDALFEPGFESMVNHKLDFEDAAGLRWFLERDTDVNANFCLHHAICR
jgi:hypothetical protein